jgi:hypothetical protein
MKELNTLKNKVFELYNSELCTLIKSRDMDSVNKDFELQFKHELLASNSILLS